MISLQEIPIIFFYCLISRSCGLILINFFFKTIREKFELLITGFVFKGSNFFNITGRFIETNINHEIKQENIANLQYFIIFF